MRTATKFLLASGLGLLLVVQAFGQQQPNQGATMPPPYGGPWYRDANVRKALNITDQQLERLNEAYDRLGPRWREDSVRLERLGDRDRAERLRELTQTYRGELARAFGGVLDETQMARYRQLDLQARGWTVFADPEVQKALNLTDEQRARLRELADTSDRTVRELTDAARTNRDEAVRKYGDFRTRTQEAINAVLTEEQRRAWNRLTGEPVTFPPPFAGTGR